MKSYVVCSLVLFQIVSVYGAGDPALQKNGYLEFQSQTNKFRNESFVIDRYFEPKAYILDWADLAEDKSQTVRVIALVAMLSSNEENKKQISNELQPFFDRTAVALLRELKKTLKDETIFGCRYTLANIAPADEKLLLNTRALALRFECAGLNGSVHVCYNPMHQRFLTVSYGLRDWYSSMHISSAGPFSMGSPDHYLAESAVAFKQAEEDDLHMLIFHRMSPEILQEQ